MSKELSLSYLKSTEIQNGQELRTLLDCLRHHASTRPNKNAFVFVSADGERERVPWKLLYEKSVSAARGFLQLGVKRQDFVAVNVRCCPDWLYIHFGIILAGARAANISFTYTDGSDVIAMMKKLGTCSTMVLDAGEDENNWGIFQKLVDDHSKDGTVRSAAMPYLRNLILLERPSNTTNVRTFNEVIMADITSDVVLPEMNENDVVSLFQTSGSTGLPKLVAHTHTSLTEFCKALTPQQYRSLYNDRPFSWIGGYPTNIAWGATRVLRSGIGPKPEDMTAFVAGVVRKERCTLLFALPPQLHHMADRKDLIGVDWPVQVVMTGGQPITKDMVKWAGTLGQMLVCVYGGTEFGMVSRIEVKEPEHFEKFSCGNLFPGCEVKIVDESGETVSVGMRGEVYVRNSTLFQEYWNDPQKTESVLTADGWFKTDDIGRLSKEGTLFVEGRKSDMIVSGGMNVNPAILETAIKTCPDVYSVMVVPISHPVLYQVVCACVVPETGRTIIEDAMRRFCESIHNDKPGLFTVLPKYYLIMEDFPETSNGKVSRKHLASIAENLLKGRL